MKIKNILVTIIAFMLLVISTYSQVTHSGTIRATGDIVGFNSATNYGPLDIKNNLNNSGTTYDIDFYIDNNKFLQVLTGGDLNVVVGTNGYKINSNYVLRHNNNIDDIFVGVGAGNGSMTGHRNTSVGHAAGFSNAAGVENTEVGDSAGFSINDGNDNVAIGYQSLLNSTVLHNNVAIGSRAMHDTYTMHCNSCNANWSDNTAVGFESLFKTEAYGCVAVGFRSGYSDSLGCALVAIGEEAAYSNYKGNSNVAVGEDAMHNNTNLSENVAIGHDALNSQSYTGTDTTFNVAVGSYALFSNDPNNTIDGLGNTTIGAYSLYSNTTGIYNVGSGFNAGYTNQRGNYNVNVGYYAGYNNTDSYQTFVGDNAGTANTSGIYNCFVGAGAGSANTTGGYNTFVGLDAVYANTTASYNSGLGLQVLGKTTTGHDNTAIGYKAGYVNTTGDSNVFVGSGADVSTGGLNNCAAFGYGTTVTASDKFYFGNLNVIGCYNATGTWGVYSDGRFKINVQENVSGLDFIKRLRPVTYNLDAQALDAFINYNRPQSTDSSGNTISSPPGDFTAATSRVHSGFIAQEVEQAALASNYSSSIVTAPSNAHDPYALNYQEFVVPLVKAVQQLDSTNQSLTSKDSALTERVSELEQLVNSCCNSGHRGTDPSQGQGINGSNDPGNSGSNNFPAGQTINLASSDPILYQNQPNPFDHSTIIRYFIPENAIHPKIIFQDQTGKTINETSITQLGQASIQINAELLNSGVYTYSLQIDGKIIDSKKMIKAK